MSHKKLVRAAFRAAVFRRDQFRCVMCGKAGYDRQDGDRQPQSAELVPLDAHHITSRDLLPHGGYVAQNGITLCDAGCHRMAEVFHQTGTAVPGFSPDDLYRRIGSSYDRAVEASTRLV